jgi:hypothetical protein
VGKASRNRRRAAAVKARRTRSGSPFWYAVTGVIVIVGVIAVIFSRGSAGETAPIANQDHWHAALGVNVCGTWLPNAPAFEQRAGTSIQAGMHSHADGLMHIHPYSSDEAGKHATVGQFLKEGGWSVSSSQLKVWDSKTHKNGEKCNGKTAKVRYSVNGEERSGSAASYHPKDGDVVALAFLPDGTKIGTPPQASAVPNDVEPGAQTPLSNAPSTTTPAPGAAPSSTTPATTTPATTPATSAAPSSTSAP